MKEYKPSIKKRLAGRTTVSAIIKSMEERGVLKGSTRNLERKFANFIDRFGATGSEWKDDNGHYSVEDENAIFIEAILIELDRKDNYTDKLLKDKREAVDPDDVIRFFTNIAEYTKDKVDEDIWQQFLAGLDEDIHYSFWAVCGDIFASINATIMNIQDLPYPHQVSIMGDLRQAVISKWAGAIHHELEELLKTKLELLEIEKELNEDEADS